MRVRFGIVAVSVAALLSATVSAVASTGDVRDRAPRAASGAGDVPGGATRGDGLRWTVSASPFRLTFNKGATSLIRQAPGPAGPGTRMSYRLADGSFHSLTTLTSQRPIPGGVAYTVATDEANRTAEVTVTRTPRGLRVEWSLSPSEDVTQVYEAWSGEATEHYLGSGMRAMYVDLKGRVATQKVKFVGAGALGTENETAMPMPFFVSSRGYGLYLDTTSVGRLAFPGAPEAELAGSCPLGPSAGKAQACFKTNRLSYEVYAGAPRDIMRSYTARIGRAPAPVPSQFELVRWRDTARRGAPDVLEDVEQFRQLDIPLGWLLIDNPWEIAADPSAEPTPNNSCIGRFAWESSRFPDPAGMIEWLRERDVRLMLWHAPFLRNLPTCPAPDYPSGSFVGTRTDRLDLDLTNPATLEHFKDKLRRLYAMGVGGVKGDRGDETDFESFRFHAGPGTDVHNTYPYLYAKAVTDVLREYNGEDFLTMFRSGFVGSQSVLRSVWVADERQTFAGLQQAIRMQLSAGASGYPVTGSDTGGYSGGGPTPELFIRWAQHSAVGPLLEVGGGGRLNSRLDYDEPTMRLFRDLVILHYELFPYHFALAERGSRTGEPVLRPLGFEFPTDEGSWRHDLQYLVGPNLLAAPVTETQTDDTERQVYLPPGEWVDLYNGDLAAGPSLRLRPTPLDEFPLYLRRGSAIPFNWREPNIWSEPWASDDLDRTDRAGWLYAPKSGERHDVSESVPYGGTFRAGRRGAEVRMELAGAPEETQVMLVGGGVPARVLIDGRPVARSRSLDELRTARQGWIYHAGEGRSGVILKLAPRQGRSEVRLIVPSEPKAGTPVQLELGEVGDLRAGQTAEVTATFANNGRQGAPLVDARLHLSAPQGWTVRPRTPDRFTAVRPGQAVRTTWEVTVPPGTRGQFALRAQADYLDPALAERVSVRSQATDAVVITDPGLVSVSRPEKLRSIRVAKQGAAHYVDRQFTISDLPGALAGGVLIPGANDDKRLAEPADYLVLDLAREATVYLAFDERGSPERGNWWPAWLGALGFERTDMRIGTDDATFVVLAKRMPAGRVTLGPTAAPTDSSSSYFTVVVEEGGQG